jgi:DNA-binding NarL/FixJ family response regulator
MKLVLADDHTLFRNGMALLLKGQCGECEILEGASLDEALAAAGAQAGIDLALLDFNMPGMNGVDGIRRFREEHPRLPVVILTGEDEPERIQAVLAAGASGFIPKSSTPSVMMSAIRLVLSGGTYIPPQMLAGAPHAHAGTISRDRGPIQLTERQFQVLRLMADGKSNKAICRELGIEEGTVKAHVASIFRALEVNNRVEATNTARAIGLID